MKLPYDWGKNHSLTSYFRVPFGYQGPLNHNHIAIHTPWISCYAGGLNGHIALVTQSFKGSKPENQMRNLLVPNSERQRLYDRIRRDTMIKPKPSLLEVESY